jgi:hypothetical protein
MTEVQMNHYKSAEDRVSMPSMNWLNPTGHANFMTTMSGRLPSKISKEALDARLERWLSLNADQAEIPSEANTLVETSGETRDRLFSEIDIAKSQPHIMDDSALRRLKAFNDRLTTVPNAERLAAIVQEGPIKQHYEMDRSAVVARHPEERPVAERYVSFSDVVDRLLRENRKG